MKLLYTLFIYILLIISLPLFAAISLGIILTGGFPVLFVQTRTGKAGKPFQMYKFRTMITGAEMLQQKYRKLNTADGPVFKIRNDPRFTRIGKFLSHTGLDELPQLFNVIRGEMSLIGPRPLPVREADKLLPWMKEREIIKPGIISPWILEGYHSRTFEQWMKSDIVYARHKSWGTDIRITLRTIGFMLRLMLNEFL
jgi:lipopolysaccharide/colanic/teichoic acid biosynthesis glycosyltransferase